MNELSLDFYGETLKIQKPKDLSLLRIQISEQFHFSDEEAIGILIYYLKNDSKQYIVNDEDYSNFLKFNLSILYLDIDQNSKLYMDSKAKLEEENIELEKLKKNREKIVKLEEQYLKSYDEKLKNINRQLDILLAKKLDLVTSKNNKINDFKSQLERIDRKINDMKLKEEKKDTLKSANNNENKMISFNKVKEALDNVVQKVKVMTNEYIFKRFEINEKEEVKVENIEKMTKDVVEEINNLSKLVIKDINEEKEKKIVLKGGAKLLGSYDSSELCDECENKNKHKEDHILVKIVDEESGLVHKGVQCKGCGRIIWNQN